ncbi:unnamed protein product, partial [Oppiella nova]
KPVPTDSWSQPLVADKWPNPCTQLPVWAPFMQNKNFSEDCLYLNIWSPAGKVSSNRLKPVMFYIHGGAFIIGSSNEYHYNGEVLASKGDVIVVTLNYRLNGFGFLYTGTDAGPGNAGLWDQVLALEWVHKNIQNFGGDPKLITVFGESAGSITTSAIILSPITRNLFKNAIMMSGSALGDTVGDASQMARYWLKQSKQMGCRDDRNPEKFTPNVINCLKTISADRLVNYTSGSLDSVAENLKSLNLMIGNCEDEGSFILALVVDPKKFAHNNPPPMTYPEAYGTSQALFSALDETPAIDGQEVSKLYFTGLSDKTSQDVLRRTIGKAFGDYTITCPTILFAK